MTPSGAFGGGITTASYDETGAGCAQAGYCHNLGTGAAPITTITNGSGTMMVGTNRYMWVRIDVANGRLYGGTNVWASGGTLTPYDSASFQTSGTYAMELTHSARRAYYNGGVGNQYVYFEFYFSASTPGTYTLNAWGNNVNGDSVPQTAAADADDMPDRAPTYTIYVCRDADGDKYYDSASPASCAGFNGLLGQDCNDLNAAINPGATETCSNTGVDNDCDGNSAEIANGIFTGTGCSASASGVCASGSYACSGSTLVCNPGPSSAETCSNTGVDNDCDGNATEIANGVWTGDACTASANGVCANGTRACSGTTLVCNPGAAGTESCSNQGVDNDCDGNATEIANGVWAGDACTAAANGVCANGTRACSGTTLVCNPGAAGTETCANTGVDNDCDGDATEIANGVHTGDACTAAANGVCANGTRACSGGSVVCIAGASGTETCANTGADNDCDGDATELTDGVHAGDACTTGLLGVCAAGTRACSGASLVCTQTTASSTEICDGLDNNCNGSVDEGCDDDNDDYCDAGMTVVGSPAVCPNGGGDCADTDSTRYPGNAEICDGKDNDCNSSIDDNLGVTTCGLGICQAAAAACVGGVPQGCTPGPAGTETCANVGTDDDCDGNANELTNNVFTTTACTTGALGICSAGTRYCAGNTLACQQTNAPGTETCSNQGTDDDCDGDALEVTNAGIKQGDACTNSNLGVCAAGTWQCQGASLVCVSIIQPGTVAETCNNVGVDNDCDGNAAELENGVAPNSACTTGLLGVCSPGKRACSGGTLVCNQDVQVSAEVCDGLDNNCDGSVDNGLPNLTCGVGECQNSVPACSGGANNTCTPKPSSAEICDDKDNDCDGVVDDGCDDDNDDYCDIGMTVVGTPAVCPNGGNDCDDTRSNFSPGALEVCDGEDNDCDGQPDDDIVELTCGVGECKSAASGCVNGVPENCTPKAPSAETCDGLDNDCDGVNDNGIPLATCGVGECARQGSSCFPDSCTPGAAVAEVCDGKDNDCDGVNDDELPMATCGVGACLRVGSTCDPSSCVPGVPTQEICDGVDNDCDGNADGGLRVAECGKGECHAFGTSCDPASCQPLAPSDEKCDGLDNDCDGVVDNGCDDDNDGYCDAAIELVGTPATCPSGGDDCDDTFADTYPGAAELCDNEDNDCNGTPDDNVLEATCGVGTCKALGTACVDGEAQDCTPGEPEEEACDGLDNDCDGIIDNGFGTVTCGVGACAVEMVSCSDGKPVECTPKAPEEETCDGVDNDCDGVVDQGEELCGEGQRCVSGLCVHFLVENVGGSPGHDGFGGAFIEPGGPAPLGGGGAGSPDDLLPGGGKKSVDEEGGCGCRVAGGTSSSSAAWAAVALLALAWARRRRFGAEARGA